MDNFGHSLSLFVNTTSKQTIMYRHDLPKEAHSAYLDANYASYNYIIDFFKKAMKPNEYFKFNETCQGYGSYDIYAVANVNGIIMAEYVRFGSGERELGTKGLENAVAALIAIRRYAHNEGVSEIHPEYSDYKPTLTV